MKLGKFRTKCSLSSSNPLFQSLFSHVFLARITPIVWEKIHEHFNLHTKSPARQLRTAMRAISLEGKSMDEYLRKIKGYVNELADVGVSVRHEEYIDALLEGLPSDYVPVIESKKHTPSIAEIEALLYGHEIRLVCYNRDTQVLSSPSLNYAQGYSHSNSYKSGDSGGSRGAYGHDNGGRGNPSERGVGRSGSGRGRGGGRFANFQCQICLKYGHTINACHVQSDLNFQPHESLTFFDPVTLQPIPYSSGLTRSSNTWINPNSKTVAQPSNQPSAMLTNSSSHGNGQASSTWISDSGASFPVTGGESQHVKQFAHFDGLDPIFIGNGEGLSVSTAGSFSFVSPNDSHITFKLHKLLHVP